MAFPSQVVCVNIFLWYASSMVTSLPGIRPCLLGLQIGRNLKSSTPDHRENHPRNTHHLFFATLSSMMYDDAFFGLNLS